MGRAGKRSHYCNAFFLEATPIVVVNDLSSVFNVYKHVCCNYMMYKFIGDLLSCGMLVVGYHFTRQHVGPSFRDQVVSTT
jgi:hypothetical protein